MSDARQLLVWGTSAHASVVVDLIRCHGEWRVAGLLDDIHRERHGQEFHGARVLGDSTLLPQLRAEGLRDLLIAIGSNQDRLRCAETAAGLGFDFPALVHPSAVIGSRVSVGAGTVVMAHAVLNAEAQVGRQVIINTGSIVEHGCRVEDGAHLCPRVVLGGSTVVGRGAWVGIGAVVKDRVRIGDATVIGAGAVVVHDVPDRKLAVGVPAKAIRDL